MWTTKIQVRGNSGKELLLPQERFAEVRGKEFLAFSLKSAAGGRSYNLFQGRAAMSDFSADVGIASQP